MQDQVIKHLKNCPITKSDIVATEKNFGANLGNLKEKTVQTMPKHVISNVDPVPTDILAMHSDITLCINIMFINKIPFFITLSRNLKFITVEVLENRKTTTVANKLKSVINMYHHRGFRIATILADKEFKVLRPIFLMINTSAADEHVPDVERCICTLKERT